MVDKGTNSAEHPAAEQCVNTELGFSYAERLENHRKRLGLMLLPLSCLTSCVLGMGLLPLLDQNIRHMPWAKDYVLGAAVWAGATLAVWAVLSWLSIPVWKFGLFIIGGFIVVVAKAQSQGDGGWMLTPTGFAAAAGILGAGYYLWGHCLPLVLARRREPASSDPSAKDINDAISRLAGPVPYETLAESHAIRFVYERVVPGADEKAVAFHDAGLRTSWVLTTHRLHYFNGDSSKDRGTVNFDSVTQWRVEEGVIFITIEFLMKDSRRIEVENILETPPINETNRGKACRGEGGGHLIKYRCPSCNAKLANVTREMAGDLGVCPKCREEFTIEPAQ